MGVRIVHHENNPFGLRVLFVRYTLKPIREVQGHSPLGHGDLPPFVQGLKDHAKICRSVADVFIIMQGRPSLSGRERLLHFPDQLSVGLVNA